jgi:hypothetical protein
MNDDDWTNDGYEKRGRRRHTEELSQSRRGFGFYVCTIAAIVCGDCCTSAATPIAFALMAVLKILNLNDFLCHKLPAQAMASRLCLLKHNF